MACDEMRWRGMRWELCIVSFHLIYSLLPFFRDGIEREKQVLVRACEVFVIELGIAGCITTCTSPLRINNED